MYNRIYNWFSWYWDQLVCTIIALGVIIAAIIFFIYKANEEKAEYNEQWNNGYCKECNVHYDFVSVDRYDAHWYACPQCKKEIKRYID